MIQKSYLTCLSILVLNACTATPVKDIAALPLPQLTFEQLKPIPVNVAKINITSQTMRGAKAWDIANTMTTPPDTAMRRYLDNRFKVNGRHGVLDIHLAKATVVQESAPNENRLLSYIPLANNEDYTLEIVLDLKSSYLSGQPDSATQTRFIRRVRMPLNVTLAYRDAKLQRTLEELIRDIDEGLSLTLSNQFNLITKSNIPTYALDVKTVVPEIQTKLGQTTKNIGDGINETRTSISKSIEDKSDYGRWKAAKDQQVTPSPSNSPVIITPLDK